MPLPSRLTAPTIFIGTPLLIPCNAGAMPTYPISISPLAIADTTPDPVDMVVAVIFKPFFL